MTLRWVAVNLLTRQIVCDLPSLESKDPFRRTMGQYETSTATLTVTPDIDPNWENGILEGATACIAYTGDPGSESVVWGGLVNQAPRTLGNTIQLSLITLEGYLDRCNTGAYTTDPTNTGATKDQNTIATDLVTQFAAGTVQGIPGLPIVCQVNGPAGQLLLRQYNDYDDKTVYSTLKDLTNAVGGIEWTMHWVWTHNPDLITPYFYVGTPTATTYGVGTRAQSGLGPNVTFDETQMTDATIPHDWSSGAGGNIVTATGPGNGLARAVAQVVAPATNGRPHYELRFAPSTDIFDPLTIGQHASQALGIVQNGNEVLSCTVEAGIPGATLGTDYNLGDDMRFTIKAPTIPHRITAVGRLISYEATDTTVTPHLYAPAVS